jgi:hypothetical protein
MKNRIKLCLQVAWLTTMFVVFVMALNLCAATDQACADAGGRMFMTMAVLSFPAGFFSVVVTLCFLDLPSGDQLNVFVLLWWIMGIAGYVQWFVLVPRLFAKAEFTTLNLEQEVKPAKETMTPVAAPRPRKTKRVRSIRAYDKRGRTPLERAMSSTSTNASA